MPLAGP
jgi:hypothetical protein